MKDHTGATVEMSLPSGLDPSASFDLEVTAANEVWLTQTTGDGHVHVYSRHPGGPWQEQLLSPKWPADLGITGPGDVSFADSPSGVVVVVATVVLDHSTGFANMFITRDDGQSFRTISFDVRDPLDFPWRSVVMPTPERIVVIGGPVSQLVFASEDGGTTWTAQAVSGLPSGATIYSVGEPVTFGARTLLPIFSNDDANHQILTFAEETPGALNPAKGIAPLQLSDTFGGGFLPVAASSKSLWVLAGDGTTIFKTLGSGQGWERVATQFSSGVSLSVADDDLHAYTVAAIGTCANGKSDCSSTLTPYSTDDGGRTWTATF